MNKPKLEHIQKAIEYMGAPVGCDPAAWFISVNTRINEIALAEQQESEYITAAQARELGAGAEYFAPDRPNYEWVNCGLLENFPTTFHDGEVIKYRAIKQAQPEPVDAHAALRAEYAKQVAEGTTGFYLWEYYSTEYPTWTDAVVPYFASTYQYRCKDISCYVSKDGEPAIRMLRTSAQKLQAELGDTVEWKVKHGEFKTVAGALSFAYTGTYTYRTRATIKLDGKMVTPEQAAAEWEAKKDTHQMHFQRSEGNPWFSVFDNRLPKDIEEYFSIDKNCKFELRAKALKQVGWTGIRDDVIALLKVERLL